MKHQFIKKLIVLLLICFIANKVIAQDGKFSFTLSSSARTSAGVFKDDSILIKTLWNDEKYNAGTYTKYWDGTDDEGKAITSPSSSYKIKVLSNNVQYTWQGTIGNTSDNMTGLSKMKGLYDCMKGLAFAGGYGYYCTGYGEGASSVFKFNINTPNKKILLYPPTISTGQVDYVCTDNNNVFWGCYDPFSTNNTWVFGTKVSNDTEVPFTNGVSYSATYAKTYSHTIAYLNKSNSTISGLAVQKTGAYLFVARKGLNQLQILNKATGAVVQTLPYTEARNLSIDNDDNLWMVSGLNTVAKYIVFADGTLSSPSLSIPGLLDPVATQISPDGTVISIADGSSSQQVKFFNSANATPVNTLGVAGGYFTDANVNNTKFYFNDARKKYLTFIAYQPDGSFWVGDGGNSRVQHYNSSRTFINRIMSLGSAYSTWVDRNNIKRVFNSFMEFNIDYDVPLTGSTGWELVKNWGANITSAYDTDIFGLKHQNTLLNGRTYGFVFSSGYNELVELLPAGTLRFTGILKSSSNVLCSEGSLQEYSEGSNDFICKRYALTGFDGSNNPVWSNTYETLAKGTKNTSTDDNPFTYPSSQIFDSTNKVVFFNPSSEANYIGPVYTKGYHLAAMSRGSNNTHLFQTEKSNHRNYGGDYPKPGWFEIGNQVGPYAGGTVNIIRRNIITSYHGEFWKASQTNKFNHYYDNGLAIGQFGITGDQARQGYADSMMAGNVLSPCLVKAPNGDLYMWHGDESIHAGLHLWKISDLNTIAEQVVTISFPLLFVSPVIDYIDLMAGLPFNTTLINNTAGWSRSPATESSLWKANTSRLAYQKEKDMDILVEFGQTNSTINIVSRDLGANNVSNQWKVSGEIFWGTSASYNGNPIQLYFEILDDAGKVLTTLYLEKNGAHPIFTSAIKCNTGTIFSKTETFTPTLDSVISKLRPFTISVSNGMVNFKYSNYDPVTTNILDASADWHKPKTLRVRFVNNGMAGTAYGGKIDLSNLKLYKDFSVAPPANIAPHANAGVDKTITLPVNSTTLNGSATDADGTISIYSWIKITGPSSGTIATPTAAATAINNLAQGIYKYELTVTDNNGASAKDTIQVTVNAASNQAPAANAGVDKTITLPVNSTSLNGDATDADGTISSYSWIKIAGPSSGTIATPTAATTAINNLAQGIYKYELTVADNNGGTAKDTVQVTVNAAANQAPAANAGVDKLITLPVNSTTLNGSGTDADGTISSYAWVKISGPSAGTLATANVAATAINNLVPGIYKYELTVTDNNGATDKDTVLVTVNAAANQAPAANAGVDKTITLPVNSTTLNGSGTDADGTISSYAWIKISGPSSGTIATANAAATAINNLVQGIYKYELTVTDNKGATAKDTIHVTVNAAANEVPAANAGVDKAITLPVNSTTINGTGTDADGTISSYAWTKISGPSSGTIATANTAATAINSLVQGVYKYELTVTDNNGATAKDTVQVTVNAAANINQLPSAKAGADLNIVLPTNYVLLNGGGSDQDGTIISYSWKVINGPTGYSLNSPQLSNTKIENLFQGIYNAELTVKDNDGAIARDTLTITVSSPRLSNYAANAFTVYPNPVKDIANLNIETINGRTKLFVSVADVGGRLLKYQEMVTSYNDTVIEMDLSNLSNGYYIITIRFDDGKKLSTKIIKYGVK